jgi:hypothetical protein
MKRFATLWVILASSYLVASMLIAFFTGSGLTSRLPERIVTLLCVTAAQTAVLHFSRPAKAHESPDQHR